MKRALGLILLAASAAFAQQPRIENGRIDNKPVSGDLTSTMKAFIAATSTPAWIGYSVPIIAGDRRVCGWDGGTNIGHRLSLEGPTALFVLFRVEQNRLNKIRMATPDCDIDAGGLQVTWLTQVNGAQSVAYLETIAGVDKLGDAAMSAMAMHQDPAADRALESMLNTRQPDKVREKAVMWLSIHRGRYERVVRVAHDDPSARVRGQAIFWLAQGAQKKLAADTAANAIDNDPETEVKKKAVFALSQLSNGDGVPKLIDVAKTNRNPEVRKQAIFWLGQSKDARALKFLEEVLAR